MQSIGTVLGWKFNHHEGITTENNVLVEWPDALGPKPTQAQLDDWTTEYENYLSGLAAAEQAKKQAIVDNFPSWNSVSTAIDAADNIVKLRAIVKKLARVVYWDVKNSES